VKTELTKRLVENAVEWMVLTALNGVTLTGREKVLANARKLNKVYADALNKLVGAGCCKETLFDMVAVARELQEVPLKFNSRELEPLARDIEDILDRMKRLIPFTALPMADDDWIDTSFPLGKLHLWQEFEKQLLQMAQVCDILANLRKTGDTGGIQAKNILERFGYLLPVVYVHSRTGKPHYPKVSQLLWSLGNIGRNKDQLCKDYKWAQREHLGVVVLLRRHLDVVIEGFSYDGTRPQTTLPKTFGSRKK
jgi:hypothetical protein